LRGTRCPSRIFVLKDTTVFLEISADLTLFLFGDHGEWAGTPSKELEAFENGILGGKEDCSFEIADLKSIFNLNRGQDIEEMRGKVRCVSRRKRKWQ
jgi:hypothetical protein